MIKALVVLTKISVYLAFSLAFTGTFGCGTDTVNLRRDPSAIPKQVQNGDATARTASEQEFLNSINTTDVSNCRGEGKIYDRRKNLCSPDYQISDFPCTREGVLKAFSATGFQIVAALEQALGKEDNAKDRGDGFIIDQCGKKADGSLLIILVKPATDSKITVREIR